MGIIAINGVLVYAYHGVGEQERRVGNEFEVSVRLHVPESERAVASDLIDDTVNYAEVVEIIKREMSVPSKLLEHVAGRIRKSIIQRYGSAVTAGEVTVEKLGPPIAAQLRSVSYTLTW